MLHYEVEIYLRARSICYLSWRKRILEKRSVRGYSESQSAVLLTLLYLGQQRHLHWAISLSTQLSCVRPLKIIFRLDWCSPTEAFETLKKGNYQSIQYVSTVLWNRLAVNWEWTLSSLNNYSKRLIKKLPFEFNICNLLALI